MASLVILILVMALIFAVVAVLPVAVYFLQTDTAEVPDRKRAAKRLLLTLGVIVVVLSSVCGLYMFFFGS